MKVMCVMLSSEVMGKLDIYKTFVGEHTNFLEWFCSGITTQGAILVKHYSLLAASGSSFQIFVNQDSTSDADVEMLSMKITFLANLCRLPEGQGFICNITNHALLHMMVSLLQCSIVDDTHKEDASFSCYPSRISLRFAILSFFHINARVLLHNSNSNESQFVTLLQNITIASVNVAYFCRSHPPSADKVSGRVETG